MDDAKTEEDSRESSQTVNMQIDRYLSSQV